MAKKLVTMDHKMVQQVENVLKSKGIPCARVQLKDSDKHMLVVLNRHGEEMRAAVESASTNAKYHFGVLRNHPEYTVPRGILKELGDEEQKN